jgi:hypothetical protein
MSGRTPEPVSLHFRRGEGAEIFAAWNYCDCIDISWTDFPARVTLPAQPCAGKTTRMERLPWQTSFGLPKDVDATRSNRTKAYQFLKHKYNFINNL